MGRSAYSRHQLRAAKRIAMFSPRLKKLAVLAITASLCLLSACGSRTHAAASASAPSTPTTSLPTQGIAPAPTLPPPSIGGRLEAEHYRKLASRAVHCRYAQAANTIGGNLYIGCSEGHIAVLDPQGHVLASGTVPMYGIGSIVPAGADAIAISGFNDGATLRNELSILRATTLKPIVRHYMTDSTFLGILGDRAYIDDWCCNGRAEVYQPATIYSVSLKNGTESEHIDLAPDPQAHPGSLQPIGQGEHNYLIGKYFYVVVGPVTYRYDVGYLQRPPKRFATPVTPSSH